MARSASQTSLTYRVLKDDEADIDNVVKFIQSYFIPYEPLVKHVDVRADEEKAFPYILIKNALWQGVSIGVFDNTSGELCAVRINMLGKNRNLLPLVDVGNNHSQKLQMVLRILDAAKREDLEVITGSENYMEHHFVTVQPSYTRKGIASELYRMSQKLAIEHGCEKLIAICSNFYTRMSTEKFGYKLVNELPLKEYVDEVAGEKIFEDVEPPHTSVCLMVKTLPADS